MPKQIDHEERRKELAESVWQVILDEGINKATVRSIAKASGWSVGAVRYYFPRQEDLLTYALHMVVERTRARILTALEELRPGINEFEIATKVLEEGLPLDEERLAELHVWIAFIDRSRLDPETQELINNIGNGSRRLCRRVVAMLSGFDHPDPEQPLSDPASEREAAKLHVLWNGLSFQTVIAPACLPPQATRSLLQEHLKQIQDLCRRPAKAQTPSTTGVGVMESENALTPHA